MRPLNPDIDAAAANHSMQAFSARKIERALYEAHRSARFYSRQYDDAATATLADRLHHDYRAAAERRRQIMRTRK